MSVVAFHAIMKLSFDCFTSRLGFMEIMKYQVLPFQAPILSKESVFSAPLVSVKRTLMPPLNRPSAKLPSPFGSFSQVPLMASSTTSKVVSSSTFSTPVTRLMETPLFRSITSTTPLLSVSWNLYSPTAIAVPASSMRVTLP